MYARALDCLLANGVSMKSGLEGRNNALVPQALATALTVSMKSGLEGRNNTVVEIFPSFSVLRLNEVRPRRPEQSLDYVVITIRKFRVSMKSGLEGRNNEWTAHNTEPTSRRLNEVRPRRPEQ